MYESMEDQVLTLGQFLLRMLGHVLGALGLVVLSLVIGIAGYMRFERLSLVDAFANAAMLLGGMGPLDHPATTAGKLFAGIYALYAGLLFIAIAGVILVPVVHRVLHKLHWEGTP